ncbi:14652_t:CDS:2 [Ambispora leptoticha]|uniref:14652_t:CDS:1 n=1 Tax=Ambispora leptoticha TaxID=144679 RepID=A0A9N9C268_9GLOM|nr:14652_t:CDS:2 [Ambispora leptoticha]
MRSAASHTQPDLDTTQQGNPVDTEMTIPITELENPLLTNLANLHPAVRDLFPITDRKCLRELDNYKRKLSQYYEMKTIPPNYFDLPPPKVHLPLAYQDLSHKYRSYFSLDPNNCYGKSQRIIEELREEYSFKNLPNDYYQAKLPLLKDPNKIKL